MPKLYYPRRWIAAYALVVAFLFFGIKILFNLHGTPLITWLLASALEFFTLSDVKPSDSSLFFFCLLFALLTTWHLLFFDHSRTSKLKMNIIVAIGLYGLRLGYMALLMFISSYQPTLEMLSVEEKRRFALVLATTFALPLLGIYAVLAAVVTVLYRQTFLRQ
ncbi:MAG: hypothetical protein PHS73_02795 [Candidatus Peribacteraceae bacterium]|nr:hypothetical protein [Candidatus Peribacteraceae bacterium]